MKAVCVICPRACALAEGQAGFCGARKNEGGEVVCENYGKLTALALDPIEKKPLRRFRPGSSVLSAGSYGCNLRCPFCQNSDIAQPDGPLACDTVTPKELVLKAVTMQSRGSIGLAYTYNEPTVGYEFVLDCAALAHRVGLLNVMVTNGYICEGPLLGLLPHIDAMNIDLKGFTQRFYDMVGGDVEAVKHCIGLAAQNCHVEVTTLVIPGENDSPAEMEEQAKWLASVDPNIPLHLSRFFPRFCMREKSPTPVDKIYELANVARRHLRYVYEGNVSAT